MTDIEFLFDEAERLRAELAEMTRLREVAVREGDRLVEDYQRYRERTAAAIEGLRSRARRYEEALEEIAAIPFKSTHDDSLNLAIARNIARAALKAEEETP